MENYIDVFENKQVFNVLVEKDGELVEKEVSVQKVKAKKALKGGIFLLRALGSFQGFLKNKDDLLSHLLDDASDDLFRALPYFTNLEHSEEIFDTVDAIDIFMAVYEVNDIPDVLKKVEELQVRMEALKNKNHPAKKK